MPMSYQWVRGWLLVTGSFSHSKTFLGWDSLPKAAGSISSLFSMKIACGSFISYCTAAFLLELVVQLLRLTILVAVFYWAISKSFLDFPLRLRYCHRSDDWWSDTIQISSLVKPLTLQDIFVFNKSNWWISEIFRTSFSRYLLTLQSAPSGIPTDGSLW